MDASVRDLKAHLSTYLRRVEGGESVTVRSRRRAVARLIPARQAKGLQALAQIPGLRWNGGKPKGLARAQRLPRGVSLARWVSKNRR